MALTIPLSVDVKSVHPRRKIFRDHVNCYSISSFDKFGFSDFLALGVDQNRFGSGKRRRRFAATPGQHC